MPAPSSSLLLGPSPPIHLRPMGISHLNFCPFPYEMPQDQHLHFWLPLPALSTCIWGTGTQFPMLCVSDSILLDLSHHFLLLKFFWGIYQPSPTILSVTNFEEYTFSMFIYALKEKYV